MEEEIDFNALAELLAGPRVPIVPRNQADIFGPRLTFPSAIPGDINNRIPAFPGFPQGLPFGFLGRGFGSRNTGQANLDFFLNQQPITAPVGFFNPFLNGLPGGGMT